MNTQNKTSFSGLKKFLESEIKKCYAQIDITSPFDAKRASPKSIEELAFMFEKFHRKFQELMDKVNLQVNPKSLVFQTNQRNLLAEKEISNADNDLDEAKDKQLHLTDEYNSTPPPFNWYFYIALISVIIAICLFESILIIPVFSSLGFSLVETLGLSLLFSLILYFYIDLVPQIIALGRTRLQRRIIAALLLIFTVAFFRYLSGFRADYFSSLANPDNSGDVTVTFNPWSFVCISLFLVLVAVAINFFYPQPTKVDLQEMREYRRLKRDKKRMDAKVKRIESEIAIVQTDTANTRETNALTFLQGADLEEYIISCALTGFVMYKRQIIKYADSPPSFGDIPYPFTFNRFFITKNN